MNSVIKKLQEITNSSNDSLIELIDNYATQYPSNGHVIMALKDYAFNESSQKINENDVIDILENNH